MLRRRSGVARDAGRARCHEPPRRRTAAGPRRARTRPAAASARGSARYAAARTTADPRRRQRPWSPAATAAAVAAAAAAAVAVQTDRACVCTAAHARTSRRPLVRLHAAGVAAPTRPPPARPAHWARPLGRPGCTAAAGTAHRPAGTRAYCDSVCAACRIIHHGGPERLAPRLAHPRRPRPALGLSALRVSACPVAFHVPAAASVPSLALPLAVAASPTRSAATPSLAAAGCRVE